MLALNFDMVQREHYHLYIYIYKRSLIPLLRKEQCCFYKAATFGFLLTAFTCIALWIPWAATTQAGTTGRGTSRRRPRQGLRRQVQLTEGMDATEREISFVRWSTPLIAGSLYL